MKILILYQGNSEHERMVLEYVRDFRKQQVTRKVELVDVNTRDGGAMAELYDVVQYPAILALSNDGQILKSWEGNFPLMNELAYYTQEQ